MKTAVVLSDTHGNRERVAALLPIMREADYVFFCGDGVSDVLSLGEIAEKLYAVGGNCDAYGEKEIVLEIERRKILLAHGHCYGVKRSLASLALRAEEVGADIVLYGHTHSAFAEIDEKNILFVNPGTFSYYANAPSYAYLVIDGKKAVAKIVPFF